MERLLSASEAAERWSVTEPTVLGWARRGRIRSPRLRCTRMYVFSRAFVVGAVPKPDRKCVVRSLRTQAAAAADRAFGGQ